MLNAIGTFILIFLVSFIIEAIVEFFAGAPIAHNEKLKPYSWALIYVAAVAGVGVSFHYQFDIVALIATYLETSPAIGVSPVGIILTGLTIGRGSNAVHDLMQKMIAKAKEKAAS